MARGNRTPQATDAVALLKSDHRTVEELFARYEKSRAKSAKAKIARQICLELSVHTAIEEEIFYPGIKKDIDKDLLDEAYVEHDSSKVLIAEILEGSPDDDFYDAKVKVLSEMIKHHVKEEEQRGGMFAQAKTGDVDLKELRDRLAFRKLELTEAFEKQGIPTPTTRSMKGVDLQRGKTPE